MLNWIKIDNLTLLLPLYFREQTLLDLSSPHTYFFL